ncbi:hypothetical protein PF005_g17508 [Phytophthora fragariae]|uniref:Uncharacterized protein n=1 Tax=Phytophthora fragariae TaxID=53985 RepID=A0A6A4CNJ8_9STRA|nr:hypothetical protein PF006_g19916 [Phytophthora fragariae]KAE9194882.1 hypothetical protein PF005_g17508 [Phytophthora fragariae]KAE9292428.1 hypothetical protein PF001_g18724 [Phytophthora fragariae]
MDTWVYGVVTGYSIQGDDTRLHIQHASGACKVVLREPANVIRVDWLNYVLQPGASVNSTALNAVEILATMNDMSTLCAKVRGSSPTKVSNALSVPFIPEELVTMIKPDTLAVVMVPRQHVLECALNKKGKRGSSMFVAPSGTTTRRSAKRKAASKPTQETRPRSRQKRVIDTPSDDSESEASVLLSSDEERADKLAVQRQNQVLTSRSDQPTLNTDAMEEVRGRSATTFRPTAIERQIHDAIGHSDHQGKDAQRILEYEQQVRGSHLHGTPPVLRGAYDFGFHVRGLSVMHFARVTRSTLLPDKRSRPVHSFVIGDHAAMENTSIEWVLHVLVASPFGGIDGLDVDLGPVQMNDPHVTKLRKDWNLGWPHKRESADCHLRRSH